MFYFYSITSYIFVFGMIREKEHKNKALHAIAFVACVIGGIISKLI